LAELLDKYSQLAYYAFMVKTKPKNTQLFVRIDDMTRRKLESIAARDSRTMPGLVRKIIADFIEGIDNNQQRN
jgi:predicted DNA-binding protein